MIEGLRDKRQRLFRRLWTASVLLTAISVVALAVELLQKTDILKSFTDSDSKEESTLMGRARKPRSKGEPNSLPTKLDSSHVWSNGLPTKIPTEVPAEAPVIEHVVSEKAVIEQIGHAERQGVWLPGTITENDSEGPARGDIHDDHQSRSR